MVHLLTVSFINRLQLSLPFSFSAENSLNINTLLLQALVGPLHVWKWKLIRLPLNRLIDRDLLEMAHGNNWILALLKRQSWLKSCLLGLSLPVLSCRLKTLRSPWHMFRRGLSTGEKVRRKYFADLAFRDAGKWEEQRRYLDFSFLLRHWLCCNYGESTKEKLGKGQAEN